MKRGVKLTVFALTVALAIDLLFIFGFFGNSAARIRREHGLWIPPSASHFICRGDAWPPILDRGAASAFVIPQRDTAAFTAQLKVRAADTDAPVWIFPGNSQYKLKVPWDCTAQALATYRCDSPT